MLDSFSGVVNPAQIERAERDGGTVSDKHKIVIEDDLVARFHGMKYYREIWKRKNRSGIELHPSVEIEGSVMAPRPCRAMKSRSILSHRCQLVTARTHACCTKAHMTREH